MKLTILSPVHIGSGERKTRLNFIVQNNQAFFINEDLFTSLINLEEFINWAGKGNNDIAEFLRNKEKIKNQLIDGADYQLPVYGQIPREVHTHIKDAHNLFYIPGSSIKGAIRTALLYSVLIETRPDINQLLNGINGTDIKGVLKVKSDKWAGQELEKFVFRAGVKKEKDKKIIISYGDAKYDLLRFIHISDAYPVKAEYAIMPVRILSSSGPTKNMNMKGTTINVEVIKSGEFTFKLEVDMKGLLILKDVKENDEWIDLKPRFHSLFGFDIGELKPENLRDYEQRIITQIMSACRIFYQKKKENDLKLLNGKEIRGDNQQFRAENLINNYPQVTDGVLQLGFGTGWAGKTAGLFWEESVLSQLRRKFKLGKAEYRITLSCGCHVLRHGTSATNWIRELISARFINQQGEKLQCAQCRTILDKNQPLQKKEIVNLIWPFSKTIHICQWHQENRLLMVPMGWAEMEVV